MARFIILSGSAAFLFLTLAVFVSGKGGSIGPGEDFGDYSDEYGGEDDGAEPEEDVETGPEAHIRGVLDLDEVTFDKLVDGGRNVFVEFYAPWCSHCKALVGEMKSAAESLADQPDLFIAKVNAEKNPKLAERFDVEGYPALKFFPKGATKPQDYEGERTSKAFVEFLRGGKKGTVEKLEGLVKAFMHQTTERNKVTGMMEEAVSDLEGEEAKSGAYYVKVMSNVLKNGDVYVTKEKARLKRLLQAGALKAEKASEFKQRVNILEVFDVGDDF